MFPADKQMQSMSPEDGSVATSTSQLFSHLSRSRSGVCRTILSEAWQRQRVNFSATFQEVGVEYAGPFLVKRGNPRKPTLEKGYVAVFVSMCTRAVHLELVSSLSSEALISAFMRFVNRRGLPTTVYSDHGTNFVDANWEI